MRIAIAGGPRCGKTTLAEKLAERHGIETVLHTDDLIGSLSWSEASARVVEWMDEPGPWIIEGVAVVRGLRKWLADVRNEGAPCDTVYHLTYPYTDLSKGQVTMMKGCITVFGGVQYLLQGRGVDVLTGAP